MSYGIEIWGNVYEYRLKKLVGTRDVKTGSNTGYPTRNLVFDETGLQFFIKYRVPVFFRVPAGYYPII